MKISELEAGSKIFILEPSSSGSTTMSYYTYSLNDRNYHPDYNTNLCALVRDNRVTNVSGYGTVMMGSTGQNTYNGGSLDNFCTTWYNVLPEDTTKFIVAANYTVRTKRAESSLMQLNRLVCVPSDYEWRGTTNYTVAEGEKFESVANLIDSSNSTAYWTRSLATYNSSSRPYHAYTVSSTGGRVLTQNNVYRNFRPMFCVSGDTAVSAYTYDDVSGYILVDVPEPPTKVRFATINADPNTTRQSIKNAQINTSYTLVWDASENATSYTVMQSVIPPPYYEDDYKAYSWGTTTNLSMALPVFSKGWQYGKYVVRANNENGSSDISEPVEIYTKESDLYYYNGTKWLLATPKYWNGTSWKKAPTNESYWSGSEWLPTRNSCYLPDDDSGSGEGDGGTVTPEPGTYTTYGTFDYTYVTCGAVSSSVNWTKIEEMYVQFQEYQDGAWVDTFRQVTTSNGEWQVTSGSASAYQNVYSNNGATVTWEALPSNATNIHAYITGTANKNSLGIMYVDGTSVSSGSFTVEWADFPTDATSYTFTNLLTGGKTLTHSTPSSSAGSSSTTYGLWETVSSTSRKRNVTVKRTTTTTVSTSQGRVDDLGLMITYDLT